MTQQDLTRIGEINALLGRGTEYEGKLCFEGRVRIDGKFRGAIHSDDMLIVGDGADVDAEVSVGKLIVRGGVLRGRVFASQLVELFAPAKVYADVETPLFFVDRGVVFEGRCTMGEEPTVPRSMDEGAAEPAAEGAVQARGKSRPRSVRTKDSTETSVDSGTEAIGDDASDEGAIGQDDEPKQKRRRARKSKP